MMFVWKSFHVFSHPDKRRTSQKHPSSTAYVARGQKLLICCTFLGISLPPVSCFLLPLPSRNSALFWRWEAVSLSAQLLLMIRVSASDSCVIAESHFCEGVSLWPSGFTAGCFYFHCSSGGGTLQPDSHRLCLGLLLSWSAENNFLPARRTGLTGAFPWLRRLWSCLKPQQEGEFSQMLNKIKCWQTLDLCETCVFVSLCRENEVLKVQLKKYVGAVQMLKREGSPGNDGKAHFVSTHRTSLHPTLMQIKKHVPSIPNIKEEFCFTSWFLH